MSGPGSDEPSTDNAVTDETEHGSIDTAEDESETTHAQSEPEPTPAVTPETDGYLRWFLKTDNGNVVVVRDVLSSVAIVAVIGLILFGVSGIWPPLVAVESGSMEPNMERGDLVFVVDQERFVGDGPIDGTGVVPYENGVESGHEKFNGPGDVIIFLPNGDGTQTPIIHRAHYWVEEDENWVESQASEADLGGTSCDELETCPAPHDGFITKGDGNSGYDQARGGARMGGQELQVVKSEWVTAKGSFRIPYLGYVRLTVDELLLTTPMPVPPTAGSSEFLVGITGAAAVGTRKRVAK